MKRLPLKTTALSSVAKETHQAETGLNMYWRVQYTVLYISATQSVVRVPVTVRVPSSAGTRIFSRKEKQW